MKFSDFPNISSFLEILNLRSLSATIYAICILIIINIFLIKNYALYKQSGIILLVVKDQFGQTLKCQHML